MMTSQTSRVIALGLSMIVFVAGVSLFTSASARKRSQPAKGFVITYGVTKTPAGETPALEEIQTMFFQASGNWKQTRYFINHGQSLTEAASQGVVFSVGRKSLEFMGLSGSAERDEAFRSAAFHKNHPEFAGMDSVVGVPTYVHHAESNGTTVRTYFAVETGITPLKTVVRTWSEPRK